jgi:hypothetical protein
VAKGVNTDCIIGSNIILNKITEKVILGFTYQRHRRLQKKPGRIDRQGPGITNMRMKVDVYWMMKRPAA